MACFMMAAVHAFVPRCYMTYDYTSTNGIPVNHPSYKGEPSSPHIANCEQTWKRKESSHQGRAGTKFCYSETPVIDRLCFPAKCVRLPPADPPCALFQEPVVPLKLASSSPRWVKLPKPDASLSFRGSRLLSAFTAPQVCRPISTRLG